MCICYYDYYDDDYYYNNNNYYHYDYHYYYYYHSYYFCPLRSYENTEDESENPNGTGDVSTTNQHNYLQYTAASGTTTTELPTIVGMARVATTAAIPRIVIATPINH